MTDLLSLPLSLRLLRSIEFPRKLGVCERLYGNKLAGKGEGFVRLANGLVWRLNLSDVGHRWMVYGYYEGGVGIRYAANKLKNGGVYVDSGANIGQWICYLSGLANVKTFAFEPVPSENEWLKQCLQRNPGWDVEVISLALGDQKMEIEMQCSGGRSTVHTEWYQEQDNEIITVQVDRLDSLLHSRGVSKIDFWKLDVEGFEYEALVGAERYLQGNTIGTIYYECHPDNFSKIKTYLNSFGYAVYRLSKSGLSFVEDYTPTGTENFVAEPQRSSVGV